METKKEVKKERYICINVEIRDGEHEYNCKTAFSLDADLNIDEVAKEYTQTFFGSKDSIEEREEGNGWYWDDFSVRMCRLYTYNELTKDEYDIVKKYI